MEGELELEEPTEMGGDMSDSEDEGDRGAVVTSVECHEPATVSVSGGHNTETSPSNKRRSGRVCCAF